MADEKKLQNQILREFGTRPAMRLWRANVGKAIPLSFLYLVRDTIRDGNIDGALSLLDSPPVVSFGVKGQGDLSGILDGGYRLEVEVKSSTGKQNKDQEIYQRVIEAKGGLYILARSIEDVEKGVDQYLQEG
jgi:hypothetical protein